MRKRPERGQSDSKQGMKRLLKNGARYTKRRRLVSDEQSQRPPARDRHIPSLGGTSERESRTPSQSDQAKSPPTVYLVTNTAVLGSLENAHFTPWPVSEIPDPLTVPKLFQYFAERYGIQQQSMHLLRAMCIDTRETLHVDLKNLQRQGEKLRKFMNDCDREAGELLSGNLRFETVMVKQLLRTPWRWG